MARVLLLGPCEQGEPGAAAVWAALRRSLRGHDVVVAGGDGESPAGPAARHRRVAARNVARVLDGADAVVIAGDTLTSIPPPALPGRAGLPLWSTAATVAAARARNIPIAMVGVGASELRGSTARALCRWFLPRADLLVLRDEESAALLTDAGVRPPFWIGADPAWTTLRHSVGGHDVGRGGTASPRRVGVVVPRPPTGATACRSLGAPFDRLGVALDALRTAGWTIRLHPWQGACGEPAPDLGAAVAAFVGDDLVISAHPHAVMAAAAAGRRVVALGHGPRLTGLARRLGQVAVPAHASPPVLATALRWAIDHEPPSPRSVAEQVDLADHSLRLVQLLLEDGRLERPSELPALRLSDGAGRW